MTDICPKCGHLMVNHGKGKCPVLPVWDKPWWPSQRELDQMMDEWEKQCGR